MEGKHHYTSTDFRQRVGSTRILTLPRVNGGGTIFAKCEWDNPTGTVKDRAALAMMDHLDSGRNNRASPHILEYSGGSLARSLAALCATRDIKLTLVLSDAIDQPLRDELRAYDADIHLVDNNLGFWGVMQAACAISRVHPDWSFLYQHHNLANLQTHCRTTGREILQQLSGRTIDAWVASIGTGATLIGVYQALTKVFPALQMHAVSPKELPYGSTAPPNGLKKFAGSGGLGYGRKQPFVAPYESLIVKHWQYTYEETIVAMRRFFDLTDLRIGSSSAANWMAAQEIAASLGPSSTVVTVFPSTGGEHEWAEIM